MSKTDNYGWTAEDPESANYLNRAVLALTARRAPRRILDAGCGNGTLAAVLASHGYDVTGVDGDSEGIVLAGKRGSSARFLTADFERHPGEQGLLDQGPYDVVVSTEVVEHLYDPRQLARFAFEALRPGGELLISTPYHGYLKNIALSVAGKWDHHHTANWHGGHIKFWSRRTLSDLLQAAGFRISGFRGVGRLPFLWKSMILIAERP